MPRPAERARTRLVTGVLSWLAAVGAATVVGLTAIGAVGDGIAGSGSRPLTPAEVDALLAAAPAAPAHQAAAARPSPPADAPVVLSSPGGTVLARCVAGAPTVESVTPAQGFQLHDDDDDRAANRVEFGSADDTTVELRLRCVDGRPTADVRTEFDD